MGIFDFFKSEERIEAERLAKIGVKNPRSGLDAANVDEKIFAEMYEDILKQAKSGERYANVWLANEYWRLEEYDKAVKLYSTLSLGKDAFSLARLGVAFQNGLGVEKDLKKSFSYFEMAADVCLNNEKEPDALKADVFRQLSACCLLGMGTEKNFEKAMEWDSKAAEYESRLEE